MSPRARNPSSHQKTMQTPIAATHSHPVQYSQNHAYRQEAPTRLPILNPPISWAREMGGLFMSVDLGKNTTRAPEGDGGALRGRPGLWARRTKALDSQEHCERMAFHVSGHGLGGVVVHGVEAGKVHLRAEMRRGKGVVDHGMSTSDAMAAYGIASRTPLQNWCAAIPRRRHVSAEGKAQGPAEELRRQEAANRSWRSTAIFSRRRRSRPARRLSRRGRSLRE